MPLVSQTHPQSSTLGFLSSIRFRDEKNDYPSFMNSSVDSFGICVHYCFLYSIFVQFWKQDGLSVGHHCLSHLGLFPRLSAFHKFLG